jgi:hypothetical protein
MAKGKKKAPKLPKPGRPTLYSDALGERICELVISGLTLREITKAEDMPGRTTVFKWLARHEEFRDQYARAKELQAELMEEEILEIADDGTNDWRDRQVRDGWVVREVDTEHINRSRLRVDTRKWIMAKRLPKKYGELQKLEHSGAVDTGIGALLAAIDGKTRGLPKKS